MTCPACNHQNLLGAKICVECGTALKAGCASCGATLTPNAKFCHECGTPVAGAARSSAPAGARKVVSILFADLVGSTALHERLDPESTRRFMKSYYDVARLRLETRNNYLLRPESTILVDFRDTDLNRDRTAGRSRP